MRKSMTSWAVRGLATLALATAMLAGCASPQRMGLVVDPATGLQYGSIIERNIVVDSSQFVNPTIKVKIRNTSGDPAFDLHGFRAALEDAYAAKGYEPTRSGDFGLLLDVNVVYSGQIRENYLLEFGFLGGAAGGIIGTRSNTEAGTAMGVLAGAALGAIIGSYVTEDTYIVVADVSIAVVEPGAGMKETTIIFGVDDKDEDSEHSGFKAFEETVHTTISAYAGGRNTPQSVIAEGVRARFIRILSDII